jgi:hypothetical protein
MRRAFSEPASAIEVGFIFVQMSLTNFLRRVGVLRLVFLVDCRILVN